MTDIFQTLENRGNQTEIENHGPFICTLCDKNGKLKRGTREPWLGEGYYFWDTRIKDAHWWEQLNYSYTGYYICHTKYNHLSPLLFDMVGNVSHMDAFINCARIIKQRKNLHKISFPVVLEYLKKHTDFNFKAIRVWPDPLVDHTSTSENIYVPGNKAVARLLEKIQICFFDRTLLTQPFKVYKTVPPTNFTA